MDEGPLHPLPYADNLVNLIVLSQSQAAPDSEAAVKELLRVLTPNGAFAFPSAASARLSPALTAAGFDRIRADGAWTQETFSLRAYAADDGSETAALDLDAPPVHDGLAAAGNRLYMSAEDGHLLCFGE